MIGTHTNPIPRNTLRDMFIGELLKKDEEYIKIVPTLVLYPDPDESNHHCENVPENIKTILKTKKGETFEESVAKCKGKSILLNFCTSALEIYPKSMEDCAKIYDMEKTNASVVLENNYTVTYNYLEEAIKNNNPITPNNINIQQVMETMQYYKIILNRKQPWRIAYNITTATVSGKKLNINVVNKMMELLGNTQFQSGNKIYYEESFTPAYGFQENDYIVLDLDRGQPKVDKNGNMYVRIINEISFEMTYNKI